MRIKRVFRHDSSLYFTSLSYQGTMVLVNLKAIKFCTDSVHDVKLCILVTSETTIVLTTIFQTIQQQKLLNERSP